MAQLSRRGRRSSLRARTTGAAAAVAALALAGPAAAHDSAFVGHYTLTGESWQLVYVGPSDDGCHHSHVVNHNGRAVPNQGPFYFYHQRIHYVGCGAALMAQAASLRTQSPSEHEREHVDAARAELCARFELQCEGDDGTSAASPEVTELRSDVPTEFLLLEEGPAGQVAAAPSVAPPAQSCVTGVLDDHGFGAPRAGDLDAGVTVEVAPAALARRLGHPC